ncbi:small GTP-binding protein [Isosphaera pallida ATCC 43644]|jgi:elongation factor G|uniref:Elongation factor G n=1 Tax=Isosphaera pallida (strain ATCC 43644 / DSM 9630 / IS1B) TaxID=575540 RepID=E8R235_ISOPI|nr:elongation factor G [Isosphaera pallida]ADV62467.1 small GTP-binding protein [Isosphaera pallida ATCC 43644]
MTTYHLADIRNIALVGHGASGKTSLADALLFVAGATSRKGSVDDGSSLGDIDEEEKRRHFSIDCHLSHCVWNNKQLHFIDAPGYPDFIGGALAALAAVENVILAVSATDGPGLNSRRLFLEATKLGLGRIIVLTKMDGEHVDYNAALAKIRQTFGTMCVPYNVPIGQGPDFRGVVNVIDSHDHTPEGCPLAPPEAYKMLVEQIVESREDLMERYLEGEEIDPETLRDALHDEIAQGVIVPVLCVCVKKDLGLSELLDLVARCGLNPGDVKHHGFRAEDATHTDLEIEPSEDGELVAQVFKTVNDPFMGKLSYLRILSGRITKDGTLYNLRTGKSAKPGHLFMIQGGQKEEVAEAIAGDMVAVAKFDDLHVSDTVSSTPNLPLRVNPIAFPPPMVPRAVEAKTREDETKLSASFAKIADEDPTFQVKRDPQTHELVISGMSELHLEVLQNRLKHRYKLEFLTHVPQVPYLETIAGSSEAQHRHKKQTGGRGQFAEVHIKLRPLPRGEGFRFIDAIKGGVIPNQYIPAVEKGIREQLEAGVISGNQVVDVEVELFFGNYHDVDSSEQAFKTAARNAFRKAFEAAQPFLLEPTVVLHVVVPSDYFGAITADLSTRRGQITGMESLDGNQQMINAIVPLAEVLTYSTQLKSITGGQGTYTLELHGYDQVPANLQHKIVEKYQKSRAGIEED